MLLKLSVIVCLCFASTYALKCSPFTRALGCESCDSADKCLQCQNPDWRISLDRRSCVPGCQPGAKQGNVECQCEEATPFVSLDKQACSDKCPENAFVEAGKCRCKKGFFRSLDRQSCVAECSEGQSVNAAAPFCECKEGSWATLGGLACIEQCPFSTQPFVGRDGRECVCTPEDPFADLNWEHCVEECPAGSVFVGAFFGCNCVGETPNINLDESICLAQCPEHSETLFQNYCRCVEGFGLNDDESACEPEEGEAPQQQPEDAPQLIQKKQKNKVFLRKQAKKHNKKQ